MICAKLKPGEYGSGEKKIISNSVERILKHGFREANPPAACRK